MPPIVVLDVRNNELLGEVAAPALHFYATVTREPYHHQGRITDLLASGRLIEDLGMPPLDPAHDRVMICGNPGMLQGIKALLETRGFGEGSGSRPGDFVIERAFVDR